MVIDCDFLTATVSDHSVYILKDQLRYENKYSAFQHQLFILHLNVATKRVVVSSRAHWDQNHPLNATLLPISQSIVSCQLIHLLVMTKNTDEVRLIPN
jgi:hypothetical protein